MLPELSKRGRPPADLRRILDDVPLLALFALNELNFSWITHMAYILVM
jgi:hypothetical protein